MTINKIDENILDFILNCFITIEPCRRLKNLFSNLSSFYIIDVDTILKESGLDVNKKSHQYLINVELERLLSNGARSKRYAGIIYINTNICIDVIKSVKDSVINVENSNVDNLVIIDDGDIPKLKDYYDLFDEVVFFPTLRKSRIIDCTPRNIVKLDLNLKRNETTQPD